MWSGRHNITNRCLSFTYYRIKHTVTNASILLDLTKLWSTVFYCKYRKKCSIVIPISHFRNQKLVLNEINKMSQPINYNYSTGEHDTFSNSNGILNTIDVNITKPPGGTDMNVKSYVEYQIAMIIVHYIFPLVIFTGTIGNILSFLVLMKRHLRDTSVYMYLIVLACADNAVLYLSAFKTWIRAMFDWELLHVSDIGCRVIMWLFLVSLHMSAWLIVAMTTDRFLVVWFPFKASSMCNSKRAKLTIIGMVFLIMMYNLHVFWTLGLRSYRGGRVTACGPSMDDYFMLEIFPVMKLVSYSILPFIIVLFLNLAITVRLWSNRMAISRAASDSDTGSASRASQNRITVMLLTVSFVWLILTAPFMLWSILRIPNGGDQQKAQSFLFKTTCFLLLYVNHGINFYLYCLAGRRFRQDLQDVMCAPCARCGVFTRGTRVRSSMKNTTRTPLVRTESPWELQNCNGTTITAGAGTFNTYGRTYV